MDLLPAWRHKKAKTLDRRDVSELLDGIVERGSPIMANRTKALISKIYNFGVGRGLVEHNPCFGVPMPAKVRQRDKVLREEEIRNLWRVLDEIEPVMAGTFKMRLLSAQASRSFLCAGTRSTVTGGRSPPRSRRTGSPTAWRSRR